MHPYFKIRFTLNADAFRSTLVTVVTITDNLFNKCDKELRLKDPEIPGSPFRDRGLKTTCFYCVIVYFRGTGASEPRVFTHSRATGASQPWVCTSSRGPGSQKQVFAHILMRPGPQHHRCSFIFVRPGHRNHIFSRVFMRPGLQNHVCLSVPRC